MKHVKRRTKKRLAAAIVPAWLGPNRRALFHERTADWFASKYIAEAAVRSSK